MVAIITADLVDSSLYEDDLLETVLNELKKEFNEIQHLYEAQDIRFNIFRGDSFQGIIKEPQNALRIALQIKAAVNQLQSGENKKNNRASSKVADFRMALGIGTIDFERDSISESNGQAFQFSGRTLDEMKNESQRTKIKTPVEEINEEFNTSFFLLDMLIEKWSTASAEVVYYSLKGLKEREIAEKLNISQSAVNQRKKASGWEAISRLVDRYEQVMEKNFGHG
ncbi:hypothetical protein GCM10007103_12320 [Salinimicrobium marinum]|uniref:SatD family (SatD) n=1 Tax=Salinimicrobium marinum TaxID=680283 RepID=A0A918SA22_9FLAO|nr:hypothetical protein [Salinimicrobium marinum]GHA32210.1 hypothetical protein GCM10007103_12320 [Salinimicrobium marinum]